MLLPRRRASFVVTAALLTAPLLAGCSVQSTWSGDALARASEAARLDLVDCSCTPSEAAARIGGGLEDTDQVLGYRGGPASEDAATTDVKLQVTADAGWGDGEVPSIRCVRIVFRTTDSAPRSPTAATSIVEC